MHYQFDFYPSFAGVQIAHMEGFAIVERCDTDPNEWHIAGIRLESIDSAATVPIPPGCALYSDIALWLHKEHSDAIDQAWDERAREQRAEREPV